MGVGGGGGGGETFCTMLFGGRSEVMACIFFCLKERNNWLFLDKRFMYLGVDL